MPDVNFLRSLSTLGFDFLGLVTLEAWRFEWMAFGAAALPEILIDPCAIFSSSGRFESQWKKMDKGAFSGLGSVGYFFFFSTGAADKLRYANYAPPTFCRRRWRPLIIVLAVQLYSTYLESLNPRI